MGLTRSVVLPENVVGSHVLSAVLALLSDDWVLGVKMVEEVGKVLVKTPVKRGLLI